MKTGAITGGIGDIVYSIPVMRELNITKLYVKENFYPPGFGSMYTAVYDLLLHQGIECMPIPGGTDFNIFPAELQFDHNLDAWRNRPNRDRVHIIKNMMLHYRCFKSNWSDPFIRGFDVADLDYNLVFLTDRWRENSRIDWKKIHSKLQNQAIPFYFIGLPDDYEKFIINYGHLPRLNTPNLFTMARYIAGCKALYCNQGVALTIAQGLGKKYYLEVKPGKTNTLMYTKNENILYP